jgi:tetratricopeptide (TPR) repeat protein
MNKLLLTIFLLNIFSQNLFSEEIRHLDDSTFITREMVSPTENKDAMDAYNQGTYLMRQNQFEEAEKYFLEAIELDNNYVDAIDHLGLVYRHLQRYDDSEKMYLLSIEKNPDNIVPYLNLAIVYRFQWRYEDARQTYLRAQKIDKDDPEPYFGIGVLYQLVGQYNNSITFIDFAIQKYFEKESILVCDAFYIQGNNYYYMEEYAEALKYYKVALLYYPDSDEINSRIKEIENNILDNQY